MRWRRRVARNEPAGAAADQTGGGDGLRAGICLVRMVAPQKERHDGLQRWLSFFGGEIPYRAIQLTMTTISVSDELYCSCTTGWSRVRDAAFRT